MLSLPYKIILGSASPRRQELLKGLGLEFTVQPLNTDESFPSELRSEEIPMYLARKKAEAFRPLKSNELLITSDTIVWHRSRVLNKPENREEAVDMLSRLSGDTHDVFTAVCLRSSKRTHLFYDRTTVTFRKLAPEEISYYVDNFNVYDKAGAYGAQDWIGLVAVERIDGSYFNVMGLPVHKLYTELAKFQ